MSDWTFELVESKTLAKIGELTQARSRTHTTTLNKAGSFSMTLPLADDFSRKVKEISTAVVLKLLGEWVWSGPVWTIEEQTPDTLSVGCVGWLQTLEKRIIYPVGSGSHTTWVTNRYSDWDAGAIAIDLLSQSNADNVYDDTNYVQPGLVEPTQQRTRTYQPWAGVLASITELSDIEAGYDLSVHPRTRELSIYQKIGQIRPQAVFEYGKNLSSASRTCDASRVCNRMIAYSSIGWAQADDLVSQAAYGVLEEAVSLSDVKDIGILQAYANAELAVRSIPLKFHGFEPRQFTSARPEDPRLYRNIFVGDNASLKVDRGRLQVVNQPVRLFSATLAFDDGTGQERLGSLQTTLTS